VSRLRSASSLILRSRLGWPAPFSLGASSAFAILALARIHPAARPGAQSSQRPAWCTPVAHRTQAPIAQRCCVALFALLFLPVAAQVVLPNYSVKRTAECRYGVSCNAPRRGRLPQALEGSSAMSLETFGSLPLHDAILKSVTLLWEQQSCRLELLAFAELGKPATPHQLQFTGVTRVVVPHAEPWGPSSSVNSCSESSGTYFISMQSGDTIEVAAHGCSFAAL